jgi:hypothetical protein
VERYSRRVAADELGTSDVPRRSWSVPDDRDYVVVVEWARLADADRRFAEWLGARGLARGALRAEDVLIDTGRGLGGHDVRRYRVQRVLTEDGAEAADESR